MEKRIGTVIIYVGDRQSAPQLNEVLSRHADIIICRQGFPRQNYSLISVVFEGTTDRIGSLTGQLGRIEGIEVKSALLPQIKTNNEKELQIRKIRNEVAKSFRS
ncbi:MAG: hypothetical protein IKT08_04750 [Bacteroidales bacterium]|nr:hypothetical protein [Bacteroidales bacterium]